MPRRAYAFTNGTNAANKVTCSPPGDWLTRSVLVDHQLDDNVLQPDVCFAHGILGLVSFPKRSANSASESGFSSKHIQHVDGACPVTGPMGPPGRLRLMEEDTEKDEGEGLFECSVCGIISRKGKNGDRIISLRVTQY